MVQRFCRRVSQSIWEPYNCKTSNLTTPRQCLSSALYRAGPTTTQFAAMKINKMLQEEFFRPAATKWQGQLSSHKKQPLSSTLCWLTQAERSDNPRNESACHNVHMYRVFSGCPHLFNHMFQFEIFTSHNRCTIPRESRFYKLSWSEPTHADTISSIEPFSAFKRAFKVLL